MYFRMILLMGVTLYTSRVVLDCLGVVDYGVYNVVGGMVTIFLFMNTALAQASQRYIAFGIGRDSIVKQQKTFSMLLNVHILLAVVIFILCETIGLWLLYNKLVIPAERIDSAFWVMQCSVASMFVSVTQVPYNAAIYGNERMDTYAYISIFEAALKLTAVLSLKFFFSDKLLAYGIMMLIVAFIVAMAYRLYCVKMFELCRYHFCWSSSLFKELVSYTGWSLIGNMAWTINGQGMNFLINIFFGPVYNAARGIAASVEGAVSSFLYNFLGPSIPPIIKAYAAGDVKRMIHLSNVCSKMGFLLFMCLSVPLICVIDTLLSVWLVKIPPMCGLLCILSLLYIQSNSLSGTLQNIVQATGNVRNFQLTDGLTKLMAMPIVYALYKMGASVEIYLCVLMLLSWIGLGIQLKIVSKQIAEFTVKEYLRKVTLRELCSYVLPLFFAFYCCRIDFSIGEALGVCVIAEIICLLSSIFIGLSHMERTYVRNAILSKMLILKKRLLTIMFG